MIWSSVLLAIAAIRRSKLRSFLTILGVVIGVASVVMLVTLGNGATKSVRDQISSLGGNLLTIRPGQRVGPGRESAGAADFKAADAEAIAKQIPSVLTVVPIVSAAITVVSQAKNWSTTVTGATTGYFTANRWALALGRFFTEGEERAARTVCVIGETPRRELFGRTDPVGSRLRVKGFSCEVVGVLRSKGQGGVGVDADDVVVMPLRTVQRRVCGNDDITSIQVSVREGGSVAGTTDALKALLRERRKLSDNEEDNFNVFDTKQVAETLSGTMRILTTLLGAVAAISLLVGGIGIMNIMLVSVTERTREIGIRLAIGALEQEVLLQFLVEAVTLACFGGLVGVVVANALSVVAAKLIYVPYLFNAAINAIAFGFSALIGVVFGYVPARRAARLDPIDALRYE
ncbi:MAG: ABC transporter permease [Thermoanaerobaculia bacterium]